MSWITLTSDDFVKALLPAEKTALDAVLASNNTTAAGTLAEILLNTVNFVRGHCWVVLSVVFSVPWSPHPWAVPLLFRLYRGKGDDRPKKTALAREMLGVFVAWLGEGVPLRVLLDSGYMARAAYLMDKLMSRVGLSGKSFIPLLSSFACAIPGVMATRVIENRRDRLTTILVAPLMSCSARLPVYTVMIGAFIVSSALAGLSGFLLAPIAQASLFMGLAVGLKGFSGAMIGGLSNPRGCVIGGFALGVLESLVNLWSAQWREVAVFALVILVLAFRPTGLFGKPLVEKV